MQEIIQILKIEFELLRTETYLLGFLMVAMFLLIFLGIEKKLTKKEMVLTKYTFLGIILINPVVLMFYNRLIPDASHDMQLLWVLPFSILLPMSMVIVIELVSGNKDKLIMVVGLVILLLLSGSSFVLQKTEEKQVNQYGISAEVKQTLDLLLQLTQSKDQENIPLSLLAVDDIMFAARNYDARFVLPYGRDIVDGTISYYIHDYNSLDMQELYKKMLQYELEYKAIFEKAQEMQIEFVVLKDRVQKTSGNWYVDPTIGKIILTEEFIQQLSLDYQQNAIATSLSFGYERVEEDGPYLIFRQIP